MEFQNFPHNGLRMPQDLLQIGLEHHRNGRLKQAETSYRTLLKDDPANAMGMHWLGVLLSQAGQWDDAIHWLEQAAALRPTDAAFQNNLGQACLNGGKYDEAVKAFEAASMSEPDRAETYFSLGLALMARRAPQDAEEAVLAISQAISLGMDSVEAHRQHAAALLLSGNPDQTIAALQEALAKAPEDVQSLYWLAMAHQHKGETAETRKNLLKAVEIDSTFSRGWGALGDLEAEMGNLAQAAALYRRAIAAKVDNAAAYRGLAYVLQKSGKPDEAMSAMRQAVRVNRDAQSASVGSIADLERKITLDQQGAELHYTLATITSLLPPAQIPSALLTDLFDHYAPGFDDHLRGKLQYMLPEKIADAIAAVRQPGLQDVLDLGCGTGLCGPLLRPWAEHLCGVDLSPLMIEQAKARNVYDTLEVCDLVAAMRQAERGFDLLVAADVFIYIGDLSPVFEAAARCVRPGGLLAYSVEAGSGDRYHLQMKSKRFAHSKPYLQKLAAMHGFVEESFESVTARFDAGQPVPAYLVVLRWPGA